MLLGVLAQAADRWVHPPAPIARRRRSGRPCSGRPRRLASRKANARTGIDSCVASAATIDAAVDESGVVAGPVHDDGAAGVANHGEAHGAQQVAAHRAASPRPEHEQVGGRGELDEERARVDDLEDLVDRHARRGLLDHRTGAGQQLLAVFAQGRGGVRQGVHTVFTARHPTPGRRR